MNYFFEKQTNKKSGFSLIEMVVMVGSFGMIIVAVISTVLITFRSQNRVKANNKITENGRVILAELRRNIFNSDSNSISCGVGDSSVTFSNGKDKAVTTLACFGGNVASNSANLNSNEVTVYGCSNFVVCESRVGTTQIGVVEFNIGVSTTHNGVGASQIFNTRVTTRN